MVPQIVYVATSPTINQLSGSAGLVFKIGRTRYCGDWKSTEDNRSLNIMKQYVDPITGKKDFGGKLLGATDWHFLEIFFGVSYEEKYLHEFLHHETGISSKTSLMLYDDKRIKSLGYDEYDAQTTGYTELHIFELNKLDKFFKSEVYASSKRIIKDILPFIRSIVSEPHRIDRIIDWKRRSLSPSLPESSLSQ